MFEIEQKYADADFAAIESKLRSWGAAGPAVQAESDHYFNAPDRDFARTGEAFRLRRVGGDNFLTFKGRRAPGPTRVRREVEIPIAPGDDGARRHEELLVLLGYRPVAVVSKRRTTYDLTREGFQTHVCLDDVDSVGRYAEVEILAPQEKAAEATAVLSRLAADLGLSRIEPRSYLGLLLAKRAEAPAAKQPAIATTVEELRAGVGEARRQGMTVGLVPTMGALHEGHASLIRAAREYNDFVVASIFVNPTQFGPNEDLARYPRPFDDDVRRCGELGVDLIWHPPPQVMYPPGYRTYVEVTGLQDVLEGASRPGHFRGVATVVLKLLNQVRPDRAYFGQKDAQQALIVRQMVSDLDVPVEVVVRPTVREADGLALSSRNRYLDPGQRAQAVVLSKALGAAAGLHRQGERDASVLVRAMTDAVAAAPGAVADYAVCVDARTLEPLSTIDRPALLALAVRFGATRLIDNLTLLPSAVSQEQGRSG
jgi:pantoate--beta-alanine ligase